MILGGGVTNSYSQPVRLVPKQNREDKRTLETTVNGTLLPIYDSTMQTLNNQIGYRYGGDGGNDIVRNTGNLPSNGSNIIIDESQIETIAQIRNNMARQKGTGLTVEQAFTMLGHKDENGNIVITNVVANQGVFEQNLEKARRIQEARRLNPNIKQKMPEAEFTRDLQIAMGKHLHDKSIKNPVVIHGHTHPQSIFGDKSNNYSIHDLWGYRELQATGDAIRDDAQVLGMVINDAADFNVVGFNSSDRQFEKYDNISIGDTRLPSFSRNYGSRGR